MSEGGASRAPVATRSLTMRWSKRNIRPRLDWFVTPVRGDVALRRLALWLAAIVVGIIAGLGAVAFRALIAFFPLVSG